MTKAQAKQAATKATSEQTQRLFDAWLDAMTTGAKEQEAAAQERYFAHLHARH